jgi:N-acetylglucosamine-6-phosphate deacetylase
VHDQTDGRIRLLTCSPEWENSALFIENVCRLGIRVAIGHTLASYEQIVEAADAGASLSTHLGNGLPAMIPRHPNPIWSQLSEDRLGASLIGDGFHLPWEVLATILKVKGHRAFLVSDSTQFVGMKPGRYQTLLGGEVVLTESSRLYMFHNERLLAGSAMSLRQMIEKLTSTGLMSFSDAWELGSIRPWKYLGLPEALPEIMVTQPIVR